MQWRRFFSISCQCSAYHHCSDGNDLFLAGSGSNRRFDRWIIRNITSVHHRNINKSNECRTNSYLYGNTRFRCCRYLPWKFFYSYSHSQSNTGHSCTNRNSMQWHILHGGSCKWTTHGDSSNRDNLQLGSACCNRRVNRWIIRDKPGFSDRNFGKSNQHSSNGNLYRYPEIGIMYRKYFHIDCYDQSEATHIRSNCHHL